MLTCLHAYLLARMNVGMIDALTCLHASHGGDEPAHMQGIFDFSLPPTSTAQTQGQNDLT